MKKLAILLLTVVIAFPALLTWSCPASRAFAHRAKPAVSQSSGLEVGPIIDITIIYGRSRRGCMGFGICRIEIEWGESAPIASPGGAGKAWVENGKLRIDINRNSFDSGTFSTYFGSGDFKMEEEYTLPAEVAAALGVSHYTIEEGNYPIGSESGGNTLSLTL